jgi:hypothetical protein
MKIGITIVAGLGLALGCSVPAIAHHSGAAYDNRKTMSVEGVVEDWHWSNPHSSLRIRVPNKDGGAVVWVFEALPAGMLTRNGYRKSSFKPGDTVTVVYGPLRDGAPGGNLQGAVLADGTTLGTPPPK